MQYLGFPLHLIYFLTVYSTLYMLKYCDFTASYDTINNYEHENSF